MIKERIGQLRKLMKEAGVNAYLIETEDFHGSEYVGEYFKEREYMSGFTGSAGSLVVTMDRAALWTDGRYFLQAEEQLKGSGIELMKIGTEGTPGTKEFLLSQVKNGQTIGFDGRTISALYAEGLKKEADKRNISLNPELDLPDRIWTDRPRLKSKKVWELDTKYAGMDRIEKLTRVREMMKKENADVFVLSSIDDIAWLLNLRGDDVECNPVFLSYMIIFDEKAYLYADNKIFSDEILIALAKANVEIRGYNNIYKNLKTLTADNILLDEAKVNFAIINSIDKSKKIINRLNPTTLFKAVKTPVEMENMRKAHIKDGAAVTRFMHWIKKHAGKEEITEISGADKLEEFRRQQENYLGASFEPIFAYGEHGAIVHYSATKESNAEIKAEGFLLTDTGGQYLEGTTDITRTFALGELTKEQKKIYTLVLAGNLELGAAKFKENVRGCTLDMLARQPLWEHGLDFNHGTGHGVGFLLNVHEGPQRIAYGAYDSEGFKEGMITSNEPGMYLAGQYGVRLENLTVCVKKEKNEYGQFLGFETLTMVPWDLEAVDKAYLTDRQVRLLNEYHKQVFDAVSQYMDDEELKWLKEATREI
ncbi:MAG: aminopeptidase P family protein [Lachnospiraceae bacterium]